LDIWPSGADIRISGSCTTDWFTSPVEFERFRTS
jgi:hypothetical protein